MTFCHVSNSVSCGIFSWPTTSAIRASTNATSNAALRATAARPSTTRFVAAFEAPFCQFFKFQCLQYIGSSVFHCLLLHYTDIAAHLQAYYPPSNPDVNYNYSWYDQSTQNQFYSNYNPAQQPPGAQPVYAPPPNLYQPPPNVQPFPPLTGKKKALLIGINCTLENSSRVFSHKLALRR